MPKDTEKYQYFTVGLLKSSFALEALKADAAKHHMVEQPARLIALRLTEYYDLLTRVGPLMPSVSHFTTQRSDIENGSRPGFDIESDGQFTYDLDNEIIIPPHNEHEEEIVTMSADAEQNADLAADYWAIL
ncbi:MAG: hypothetical protein ACXVDN_21255 [Ktedonobacteraceae bacterium]